VLAGRRLNALEETLSLVREGNGKAAIVQADISKESDAKDWVEKRSGFSGDSIFWLITLA